MDRNMDSMVRAGSKIFTGKVFKNKVFILSCVFLFCSRVFAVDPGNALLDSEKFDKNYDKIGAQATGQLDLKVDFKVKAENHDKLKLQLVFVGKKTKKIDNLMQSIKKDLEFSGQFDVLFNYSSDLVNTKHEIIKNEIAKNEIVKYFTPDCRLGIFFTVQDENTFAWRLYDLEYAQMIKGEKYMAKAGDFNCWAHNISDAIWPNLTCEKGFFSTKIVYSKKIDRLRKKDLKHIYVADYDGSNEKLLVSTPTVCVAPRWNNDLKNPLVFYSEHTNKNVRLMVVDMSGKRKVASNFDGLNILSAFSPDGKKFAYCASKGDGSCNIYYYDGKLKKLTKTGNNIAPTFGDNGNAIYFCSDAHSKFPQIYKYDLAQMNNSKYLPECMAKDGFYVATVFNNSKNLLAYSKMVNGLMQIFVYNPVKKTHKQVTFGVGNKEECSWSPCGNYLLFSVENNNKSRLAVQNLLTGKMCFITKPKDNCYYPNWSPIYQNFPVVA